MSNLLKRIKNERGSQLIEFLAVFPLIIFAFLLIWQMAMAAYTVVVSEAAARDGARVASVEGDYQTAVERSAYGLDVTSSLITGSSSYGKEVTVIVHAKMPMISIPFVGKLDYTIDADATIPVIEENDD
ncbi:pilus assembly protein [Virgibacillus necropolis]|uniref:TadE/TadG family type IV pilus assembly protein n=1 Tax=Virgibacillus necropolis TaxID=163877 RepID=UPI003850BADD